MNFVTPVADSPDLIATACSICRAPVSIPCVPRVNTCEGMDSLLAGTLNTAPCPSCGELVTSEMPVHIDMPELGIGYLRYTPLDLLENASVCEGLLNESHYQQVFYSLDELTRQVRARLHLSRFSPTGLKTENLFLTHP